MRRLLLWFVWRRRCKWCKPAHYYGGAPWAWRTTDGICRKAFDRVAAETTQQ